MNKKLMTPGPTPLPPRVIEALGQQVLHHRTKEYAEIFERLNKKLKFVFAADYPVITLTASGTGGMEAAVTNCFSPGDEVVLVSSGVFSERFFDICRSMELEVKKLEVPWGKGIGAEEVMAQVGINTRGVIVTHNETSTGAKNDIEAIGRALKGTDVLLVVDAVSSLGGMEVRPQEWGIDVVVTSSQKALMCPPGLTFLAVSPRAVAAARSSKSRRHYWDLCKVLDFLYKQPPQNPFTPAVNLVRASLEALSMIQEEGLENVWQRHRRMGQMARAGVRAMGLTLFAEKGRRSDTLTAVSVPDGIDAADIIKRIEKYYGIVIAGGNKSLKGRIIRIAHMGYMSEGDVLDTLGALERVLTGLGYPAGRGAAAAAAGQIMNTGGTV